MRKEQSLLRVVRAAHQPRMTQSQAARRAGLGSYRYWQIENGEGPPSTKTEQDAIASALGVRVAEIAWPEIEERSRASA